MRNYPELSDFTREESQFYGEAQFYLQLINYPYLVDNIYDAKIYIYIPILSSFTMDVRPIPLEKFMIGFLRMSRVPKNDSQRILLFHFHGAKQNIEHRYSEWNLSACKYCIFGIHSSRKEHQNDKNAWNN